MNPVTVADTRLDCSNKRHDKYGQGPGYIVSKVLPNLFAKRTRLSALLHLVQLRPFR